MSKTPKPKKTSLKNDLVKGLATFEAKVNRRKEWRLDLPLSAIVEGTLPQGKKFKESTTLKNISSKGAYFCLDSGLLVGSKVNLVIDLPVELTEGKKFKLCLGGITVRLEDVSTGKIGTPERGKKQGVAIRFSKKFKIIQEDKLKLKS
ncbi:MAG: PilZ domain-containing protein [Candidatus Aminicenantaceae bacterium]